MSRLQILAPLSVLASFALTVACSGQSSVSHERASRGDAGRDGAVGASGHAAGASGGRSGTGGIEGGTGNLPSFGGTTTVPTGGAPPEAGAPGLDGLGGDAAGTGAVAGTAGSPSASSAGAGGDAGEAAAGSNGHAGEAGSGSPEPERAPPSCAGMLGNECQGGNCCTSLPVEGGTFTQGKGSGTASSFSATVSSFSLDEYEITVGRFRAFAGAYDAWRTDAPQAGAGANPHVDGSGWDATWDDLLPADSAALKASLACGDYPTYAESGNDTLPVLCIDFYTAFAFCIWDGGRLPTESEWEYAAAGGMNETTYPWGDTPVPTNQQDSTAAYATYDCLGDDTISPRCTLSDILPVGSKPAGNGRYGQRDLAGSAWEWTRDDYASYPASTDGDYAHLGNGEDHVLRGGSWYLAGSSLRVTWRAIDSPGTRSHFVGARCARDP
jgi:formylglycine-generating enzyme required for sulfatase activity